MVSAEKSLPNKQAYPVWPVLFGKHSAQSEFSLPFDLPTFLTSHISTKRFSDLSESEYVAYRRVFEKQIERAIAEFNPDVISVSHGAILGDLVSRSNVPYVVTPAMTETIFYKTEPRFRQEMENSLRSAYKIICVSKTVQAEMRANFQIQEDKLAFYPPGIDQKVFRPRASPARHPGPKTLLFIGRLIKEKGIPQLLQALSQLRPGWRLTVVGDGYLRSSCEVFAIRHALPIRFTGHLPHEDIPALLQSADAIVIPSLVEAIPLVALEALACGISVLGTRVGMLPDILGYDSPNLCAPGDVGGLRDILDAFVRATPIDSSASACVPPYCSWEPTLRAYQNFVESFASAPPSAYN